MKTKVETVYEIAGFKDRQDYLDFLAVDYGQNVYTFAEQLGELEDFDELVVAIESLSQ
jgi:hypothetical protein